MKNTMFEDLAQQLVKDINRFVESGRSTAEAAFSGSSDQMKTVIESALKRMDIVTREEFDAQQAVLLRTRELVAALEVQVAALEETVAQQQGQGSTATPSSASTADDADPSKPKNQPQ